MKFLRAPLLCIFALSLGACATYHSPDRATWRTHLRGASMTDMTEAARVAKRPVFLGAGGRLVLTAAASESSKLDYGDKATNDNTIIVGYMAGMEYALYDALRKPGISVQRAGTDVVIILVRDALMALDMPDISVDGADTLRTIAKILNKYDATFIEIAGYTDAMRDKHAADALSMDMAQRVAVFLAQKKVNPTRMFIAGRGAARPIAAQDDSGRLMNRRVEIRIAPAR